MPGPDRRTVLRGGGALVASAFGLGAAAGCAGGPPPVPVPFRLATGPDGAVFREIGAALARELDRAWGRPVVELVFTDAAPENITLLAAGGAEMAFVNIDAPAADTARVRALARVYDSVMHVLVPTASTARDLRDLDGATVAAGLPRSGTRWVSERLLAGTGARVRLRDYSQADSVRAFRAGEVDAVFSLTGMPTPAVTALAGDGTVRLLDLSVQVEALLRAHPLEYVPVVVPATMYPPMPSAPTAAVPTLLAVPPATDERLAHWLTDQLFANAARLARVRQEAGQINPRTGAATTPIALHPGARRWFRERKP